MDAQLQTLLNKIGVILLRQELLKPVDNKFNIFKLLRPAHDEVNLHSRFLYELLNPKGSHGLGTTFLRLFAHQCKFPSLDYDNVRVYREHANIDVLIQDLHTAVVIENKIYAEDQPKQLERYHDHAVAQQRRPILYYLTLDGHDPSPESLGGLPLDAVQNLSYAREVDDWLTACIKEAALLPTLRETLTQYQKLTRNLTGTTVNDTKKELIALLEQGDNGVQAALIAQNWHHVRHHVELQFWKALQQKVVNAGFLVLPEAQFDSDIIHQAIHKNRGRSTGYGLKFGVGSLLGIPVLFKITRGQEAINYGLVRPQRLLLFPESAHTDLLKRLDNFYNVNPQNFFLMQQVNTYGLDFEAFNTATVALVNTDKRTKIVEQLWDDIETFIKSCQSSLHRFEATITPQLSQPQLTDLASIPTENPL